MSAYLLGNAPNLYNADGSPAGQMGLDGVEYPSSVSGGGVRAVATRGFVPNSKTGALHGQGVSYHVAKDNLTAIAVVFCNWNSFDAEVGMGTAQYTASVEYPFGTIAGQFTFSGAVVGNVANSENLVSDMCQLNTMIPKGAAFRIRTWVGGAAGHMRTNTMGSTGLDFYTAAASLSDLTMTPGVNPAAATTSILGPTAIIGMTTNAAALIIGDSIGHGSGDVCTAPGDQGIFGRSLGQYAGYISAALPGEAGSDFIANGAKRRALQQYCTHVFSDYGTQDIAGGQTAAAILATHTTIAGYFSGKPFYQSSILPRTTGTWSAAAGAGQTVTANEAVRLVVNASIASGTIPGVAGWLDTQKVLESSPYSGFWGVTPGTISPYTANWTNDGTHPNAAGYSRVQASGAILPLTLLRT